MITVSIKIIGAVTTMGSALINTPYINLKIDAKVILLKIYGTNVPPFFVFNTLITCGTNVIPTNTPLEYPKKSISISSPKSLNNELL